MTEPKVRPSVAFLHECFDSREGVLYWKVRPVWHFQKPADQIAFNSKTAGKKAGKLSDCGYVTVGLRIGGRAISMAGHRIVWAMHHGRWPELLLDHINRVRNDNRIENLREVTPAGNAQNSSHKRVHMHVHEHRIDGRFAAWTSIGGQKNVWLGLFDSEAEAVAHRDLVNDSLEGLARSLAKKSKTGRPRKEHQPFSQEPPMLGKDTP